MFGLYGFKIIVQLEFKILSKDKIIIDIDFVLVMVLVYDVILDFYIVNNFY